MTRQAHQRGLAIFQKNAPGLVKKLAGAFDGALTEDCLVHDECARYARYANRGKPVFMIEYTDTAAGGAHAAVCAEADRLGTGGSRTWSCTMAETGSFEHDSGNFAENIAYGYPDAAAVHKGWMESTGHRNNRMNAGHTEYGIGLCKKADGTLYWTERFR